MNVIRIAGALHATDSRMGLASTKRYTAKAEQRTPASARHPYREAPPRLLVNDGNRVDREQKAFRQLNDRP